MSRNIILNSVLMVIALSLSITLLSLYNLRNASIKSAIHNAVSISEAVKSGLTSYMVNDNMHQVGTFIQSVSNMRNVDKLWLARSEYVNKQFGHVRDIPRDDIDKKVLNSGKMYYEIDESITKTTVRVTIPYNAIADKGINCLKCHNVEQGTTLGAISLILDINTLKEIGIESIYIVSLFILLTIIFFLIYNKKYIMPYFKLYELFKYSISNAIQGNFEKISPPKELSTDIIHLTREYNNLLEIFKDTTDDIDKKLQVYTGYKTSTMRKNPLKESKFIVDNLSNLYQYKKQIELDSTLEEIYTRLKEVMQNRFGLKNFTFMEIDSTKQKMRKVAQSGESFYCEPTIKNNPELCRCARTNQDVVSIKFQNSCQYYENKDKYYYCINFDIAKNIYLIVHFTCNTIEELNALKEKVIFIKSYLKETTPVIEVKLLMAALKESAFKDSLTGLYNRKFLEEHSKKLLPQIKRENGDIGVLMLDMDHFKAVNDEYGHNIGDKVLKELAKILEDTVRESDIVIRYGGEEFIVLLINVKSEDAALNVASKIAQRVRENEIDIYAGTKLKKTVSIGLSMYPKDSNNLDTVIKNADIALYEAKNSGRDNVKRFKEEQISSIDLF
ncbi:GGDEF domain-containing protein [Halarcobacter anaerophilus]|uniref:GGDEF domain-containing protein n=1 Tax=Halarcobacter anaerophilus TaxID=877500 RepID=UPI0005C80EEC|nr:GGDEF domain-containing protein [Halarcobacter anaerophilus]